MKIRIIPENRKGSSIFLESQFGLLRDLVKRYPNALWRKFKAKNGEVGYELEI